MMSSRHAEKKTPPAKQLIRLRMVRSLSADEDTENSPKVADQSVVVCLVLEAAGAVGLYWCPARASLLAPLQVTRIVERHTVGAIGRHSRALSARSNTPQRGRKTPTNSRSVKVLVHPGRLEVEQLEQLGQLEDVSSKRLL